MAPIWRRSSELAVRWILGSSSASKLEPKLLSSSRGLVRVEVAPGHAGEPARLCEPACAVTAGACRTVTRFWWLRTSPLRAPLAAWIGEPGEDNAPVIAEKSSDLSEIPCSCTERPVGEFPAAIAMQEGMW